MHAAPRFVLVTPVITDAEAFAADLREVLAVADVAAVILRLGEADERTLLARAKKLVSAVQEAGAAALLDGNLDIVGKSGADGAHVVWNEATSPEAISRFRPEKIVGIGGLRTRHDCMEAGEAGADYLMFGDVGAERGSPEALVERVDWWSQIFEQPCTALAWELATVPALAAAGADFIALGDAVFAAPNPREAFAAAAASLATVQA